MPTAPATRPRQTRLRCDPGAQHWFHFHQSGPAMAADRKTGAHSRLLLPASHLINPNAAHLEAPRNLRRTIPAIQRSQHALPQILRIGLHLRLPSTSRKYYRMKCIYLNRKCSSTTVVDRRETELLPAFDSGMSWRGIDDVFASGTNAAGAQCRATRAIAMR